MFCPLSYWPFPVSQSLVYLPLTGTENPVVGLRAPTLSLVIEFGSETGLNWCWGGLPFPTCLPLLYIQVPASHLQLFL